jgi:hypothetical protein
MGRIYTGTFSGVSSAAVLDLIEVQADPGQILVVHSIEISQLADVGDAEEEMIHLRWSNNTGSGSSGSAGTLQPILVGDPAAQAAFEYGNTTQATGGTILFNWYWNIRVPFHQIWTPETRPILAPSDFGTLSVEAAPSDSLTYAGNIMVEEIG